MTRDEETKGQQEKQTHFLVPFRPPSGIGWENRGETKRIVRDAKREAGRETWPRGEWDTEPDRVEWFDKATGMPCPIVRNPMGALCGYVGVPEEHPHFGKGYDNVDYRAHGGLTYADACQVGGAVCHAGDDKRWWFGFDCAHHGDEIPGMLDYGHQSYDEWYKNLGYVRSQVEELASQIVEVARG